MAEATSDCRNNVVLAMVEDHGLPEQVTVASDNYAADIETGLRECDPFGVRCPRAPSDFMGKRRLNTVLVVKTAQVLEKNEPAQYPHGGDTDGRAQRPMN